MGTYDDEPDPLSGLETYDGETRPHSDKLHPSHNNQVSRLANYIESSLSHGNLFETDLSHLPHIFYHIYEVIRAVRRPKINPVPPLLTHAPPTYSTYQYHSTETVYLPHLYTRALRVLFSICYSRQTILVEPIPVRLLS